MSLKDFNWGQSVFCKIYPVIQDTYDENQLENSRIHQLQMLGGNTGEIIENKLLDKFTPSFFTKNLCEKKSLIGRVSIKLFSLCSVLGLNKKFKCLDQSEKLCSVILKAEACWLGFLTQQSLKNPQISPEKACTYLSEVVALNDKERVPIENKNQESIQETISRLNHLTVITHTLYIKHGLSHNHVTGAVPSTYFAGIFNKYLVS